MSPICPNSADGSHYDPPHFRDAYGWIAANIRLSGRHIVRGEQPSFQYYWQGRYCLFGATGQGLHGVFSLGGRYMLTVWMSQLGDNPSRSLRVLPMPPTCCRRTFASWAPFHLSRFGRSSFPTATRCSATIVALTPDSGRIRFFLQAKACHNRCPWVDRFIASFRRGR